MIGQESLKEIVDIWKMTAMPRSILVTGSRGSGRTTFCKYIGKELEMEIRWLGNKVEDVRDMIVDSQKIARPTIYVFQNSDEMSAAAKNSLLKVTEEPPKFASIIMIIEDVGKMLTTIRSRSVEIAMCPYSDDELSYFIVDGDSPMILSIARTPGEIQEARSAGVDKLIKYVQTVIDNIRDVSFMNSMKIPKALKFKDEDEGFSVVLFFRTYLVLLAKRFIETSSRITMAESREFQRQIFATQSSLTILANRSLSKKFVVDMWIVRIREEIS